MWNSTEFAATIQNAVQCYCVLHDEGKRATTQTLLDHFFKRLERIESSKEPELVPSTSSESESAACPLSPVAADPSVLPSPTASPVGNSSRLFTRCQLLYYITVILRYNPVRLKHFLYFLCLFFIYYLCENYCKPISVHYHITHCVSWVPKLTLLDL